MTFRLNLVGIARDDYDTSTDEGLDRYFQDACDDIYQILSRFQPTPDDPDPHRVPFWQYDLAKAFGVILVEWAQGDVLTVNDYLRALYNATATLMREYGQYYANLAVIDFFDPNGPWRSVLISRARTLALQYWEEAHPQLPDGADEHPRPIFRGETPQPDPGDWEAIDEYLEHACLEIADILLRNGQTSVTWDMGIQQSIVADLGHADWPDPHGYLAALLTQANHFTGTEYPWMVFYHNREDLVDWTLSAIGFPSDAPTVHYNAQLLGGPYELFTAQPPPLPTGDSQADVQHWQDAAHTYLLSAMGQIKLLLTTERPLLGDEHLSWDEQFRYLMAVANYGTQFNRLPDESVHEVLNSQIGADWFGNYLLAELFAQTLDQFSGTDPADFFNPEAIQAMDLVNAVTDALLARR